MQWGWSLMPLWHAPNPEVFLCVISAARENAEDQSTLNYHRVSVLYGKTITWLATALACLLVLGLQHLGIHPVPSSALVTVFLVGAFATLEVGGACGPAIMCGSFAGMSILPDLLLQPACDLAGRTGMLFSLLLSVGVGSVYLCTHSLSERYPNIMLNGFGGKLGATAFAATFLCTTGARAVLGLPYTPCFSWSEILSHLHDHLFSTITFFSIAASVAGAVVPLVVQGRGIYRLTANGRVVVTALWGLCIGGMLLLIPVHGGTLASCWYMGTFVSMTAIEVISPLPFLMVAGVLTSVLITILKIPFHGFGGVLGLSALLSVIVTYRLEPLRLHLRNRLLPDRS